MKEKYQVLTILTFPRNGEEFADILWSVDCLGFQEEESSGNLLITAWFTGNAEKIAERVRSSARIRGISCLECSVQDQEVDTSECLATFNRSFSGIKLGNTFFIHPPWIKPSRHFPFNILLEPGHAFGTGTHESTQLALLAMALALIPVNKAKTKAAASKRVTRSNIRDKRKEKIIPVV